MFKQKPYCTSYRAVINATSKICLNHTFVCFISSRHACWWMGTSCLFCIAHPCHSHAGSVPSIVPHGAHKLQCATIWHRGAQVWVFQCDDVKYDDHTSWLTMNSLTYIGSRGQEPFFGHMCSASWMGSTERISSEESLLGTLAFIMQWNKWMSVSDYTICL